MGQNKYLPKIVALLLIVALEGCAMFKPKPKPSLPAPAPVVREEHPPAPQLPPVEHKPAPTKNDKPKESEAEKASKAAPLKDDEKFLVLNFNDAELDVVLQTICELLGMNYMIGSKVKGKITIQTYKKIPREELRTVLNSILEINGLTLVETGRYVKVVPSPSAKQYPIETRVGKDDEKIPAEDIMVTQLIPLQHISVSEIESLIRPLVSKDGTLISHKNTNLLIMNDISANIKRLLKIINMLDIPAQAEIGEKVFVYYVENGEAETLASILEKIYGIKKKDKQPSIPKPPAAVTKPAAPMPPGIKAPPAAPVTPVTVEGGVLPELAEGEINFVAVKEINAIVVKTTPRNFQIITQLLKKLDILPKQVLIEVLIADISLTDELKFGVQWFLQHNRNLRTPVGFVDFTQSISAVFGAKSGFFYSLSKGDKDWFAAWLDNIQSNAKVLASPHVLTADNKEATINIVNQYPILKTTYTGAVGTTSTPVRSVEFKDIGIKLSITPSINEQGLVTLKVNLEYSTRGDTIDLGEGQGTQVSFNKRDASTTLIVKDEQPVIIGGLIREDKGEGRSGIPFLMDIPVLGYLFGSTSQSNSRSELVLMITPRVIDTWDKSRQVTEEFGGNVRVLSNEMKRKGSLLHNAETSEIEENTKEEIEAEIRAAEEAAAAEDAEAAEIESTENANPEEETETGAAPEPETVPEPEVNVE